MSKDSKHSNVNKQPKNKLNEKSLFTKSLRFYNGKPSQTVIISKLAVFKDVTRLTSISSRDLIFKKIKFRGKFLAPISV